MTYLDLFLCQSLSIYFFSCIYVTPLPISPTNPILSCSHFVSSCPIPIKGWRLGHRYHPHPMSWMLRRGSCRPGWMAARFLLLFESGAWQCCFWSLWYYNPLDTILFEHFLFHTVPWWDSKRAFKVQISILFAGSPKPLKEATVANRLKV